MSETFPSIAYKRVSSYDIKFREVNDLFRVNRRKKNIAKIGAKKRVFYKIVLHKFDEWIFETKAELLNFRFER